MTELLQLSALGAVLALDATSVGQFMVSRPLVAGAIAGWLSGDPSTGLALGAMLEVYLLVSFPTGGGRFPEGSTATVVAVAAAAAVEGPAALPGALAFGLVWGHLGGLSVTAQRKLNGRLVPEPADDGTPPRAVVRAHVAAVFSDLVRGGVVTAAGVVAGPPVVSAVALGWPLDAEASRGLLLVGAATSAGIFLRDLGGLRARRLPLALGFGLGILGARFL